MYEIIDSMQESDTYYYIDYIPYNVANSEFLELEAYFEKTYLQEYAKKISRIALKLIYYYSCEVYVTEYNVQDRHLKFEFPSNTDIRGFSPEKIAYIIEQVVRKDFSSVQILFSTPRFLFSISGGFSVFIYSPPEDAIQLLNQLISQEGLFFKRKEGDLRCLIQND